MHMKCTLRSLAACAAVVAGVMAAGARADTDRLIVNAVRYDQEYPVIDYSGPATHNRVWRMQQKIDSGALKLQWEPRWGYLRSVLQALDIDIDSQVLVFSKKIWDGLSKEDQAIIRAAAEESVPYMRKLWDEREASARKTVEAAGSQVVSDVDKKSFSDAMAPVYAKFAADPKLQDLVKRIQATP